MAKRDGRKVQPSPGERIKARKKREEEWWTGKSGKYQATYIPGLDKQIRQKKPHSSPEGRMADLQRYYKKGTKLHADPGYRSGGKATHGYGKAYMKGGRAK